MSPLGLQQSRILEVPMVRGDAVGGRWVSHRDGSWALDRKLEPRADSTEAAAPGIGVKVSTSVFGSKADLGTRYSDVRCAPQERTSSAGPNRSEKCRKR